MDFGIDSILTLYKRVTPALNSKRREFLRHNIEYIKNEDIWNYLVKKKWISVHGLTLFDIVGDILNTSLEDIDNYKKDALKGVYVKPDLVEIETL